MQGINITDDKKIEILLKALEERYSATRIIRERVQNICIWSLGLFVTAAGVVFQPSFTLTCANKIHLTILTVCTALVVIVFYLKDLHKGFNVQLQVQARIENILGLCKPNIYSNESVYPQAWAKAGTTKGKGNFFFHSYLLIILGAMMFVVSIWLK